MIKLRYHEALPSTLANGQEEDAAASPGAFVPAVFFKRSAAQWYDLLLETRETRIRTRWQIRSSSGHHGRDHPIDVPSPANRELPDVKLRY